MANPAHISSLITVEFDSNIKNNSSTTYLNFQQHRLTIVVLESLTRDLKPSQNFSMGWSGTLSPDKQFTKSVLSLPKSFENESGSQIVWSKYLVTPETITGWPRFQDCYIFGNANIKLLDKKNNPSTARYMEEHVVLGVWRFVKPQQFSIAQPRVGYFGAQFRRLEVDHQARRKHSAVRPTFESITTCQGDRTNIINFVRLSDCFFARNRVCNRWRVGRR